MNRKLKLTLKVNMPPGEPFTTTIETRGSQDAFISSMLWIYRYHNFNVISALHIYFAV